MLKVKKKVSTKTEISRGMGNGGFKPKRTVMGGGISFGNNSFVKSLKSGATISD